MYDDSPLEPLPVVEVAIVALHESLADTCHRPFWFGSCFAWSAPFYLAVNEMLDPGVQIANSTKVRDITVILLFIGYSQGQMGDLSPTPFLTV